MSQRGHAQSILYHSKSTHVLVTAARCDVRGAVPIGVGLVYSAAVLNEYHVEGFEMVSFAMDNLSKLTSFQSLHTELHHQSPDPQADED
jgi:shikimate kinase